MFLEDRLSIFSGGASYPLVNILGRQKGNVRDITFPPVGCCLSEDNGTRVVVRAIYPSREIVRPPLTFSSSLITTRAFHL